MSSSWLKYLLRFRVLLTVLLVPLILSPIPLAIEGQESKCGWLMLVMGVFWCIEVVPVSVTALLPLICLPLFGIMPSSQVSIEYMSDMIMMVSGGIFIALAIQRCELHKRLALGILLQVGTKPRWLMLGFILPSWFLSMWINNTAATAMMIPIIGAVMDQIRQSAIREQKNKKLTNGVQMNGKNGSAISVIENGMNGTQHQHPAQDTTVVSVREDDEYDQLDEETSNALKDMEAGFLISVAYACNIGGTATLTGAGTNMIVKNEADSIFADNGLDSPIDYAKWMGYGVPTSTLMMVVVFCWLQCHMVGWKSLVPCINKHDNSEADGELQALIQREYKKLGRIKRSELAVITIFFAAVLLWFFRDPAFMDGWSTNFKEMHVSDATPVMFLAFFLFTIPVVTENGKHRMLLDWQTVQHKFPWAIIFMIGGGFALSEGSSRSGLTLWIGEQLEVFEDLPGWLVMIISCILTSCMTQIMCNTATTTLLAPIMGQLSLTINKNPLYLMLPSGFTASFAFMLPVATPGNGMIFATGKITIMQMVRAGILPNVICLLVVLVSTITWGELIFDVHTIPWDTTLNTTTPMSLIPSVLVIVALYLY